MGPASMAEGRAREFVDRLWSAGSIRKRIKGCAQVGSLRSRNLAKMRFFGLSLRERRPASFDQIEDIGGLPRTGRCPRPP